MIDLRWKRRRGNEKVREHNWPVCVDERETKVATTLVSHSHQHSIDQSYTGTFSMPRHRYHLKPIIGMRTNAELNGCSKNKLTNINVALSKHGHLLNC